MFSNRDFCMGNLLAGEVTIFPKKKKKKKKKYFIKNS